MSVFSADQLWFQLMLWILSHHQTDNLQIRNASQPVPLFVSKKCAIDTPKTTLSQTSNASLCQSYTLQHSFVSNSDARLRNELNQVNRPNHDGKQQSHFPECLYCILYPIANKSPRTFSAKYKCEDCCCLVRILICQLKGPLDREQKEFHIDQV